MHLCQSCIIKYKQVTRIKSNENHYPSDDAENVVDDRSMPAKVKLAYLFVVMAAGLGLKSAQRKRLCSANKLPCIDRELT
jgi:hypothetical protein